MSDIITCSKCGGSGKFIYKSGVTGHCYQCNGKAPEVKMKPSEKPVRLLPVAAIKTSWTQSPQLKVGLSTHIKQYNAVFAP